MHPHFFRVALASAVSFPFFVTAQQTSQANELDAVIVTASRFADLNPGVPANITVITREDIDAAAAMNLPDILKTRAGINVRNLYGQMGADAVVDLRGFGDTAASNTLVLLDGQRLNPIDANGINWSAIPLESVARIEIIRGSGTVLFGDRASGGVINIITDQLRKAGHIAVSVGSYAYRNADAYLSGACNVLACNLTAHYASTDGWRRNSQAEELSLAGRVNKRVGDDDTFVDFAAYRDSSGTPGSLFRTQFLDQPDMARYPYDSQTHHGLRLRPGFSRAVSTNINVDSEIAYATDRYHANGFAQGNNPIPSSRTDRTGETWSATPRLRWQHGLGALASTTVFGFDFYNGTLNSPTWNSYSGNNVQRAAQNSASGYLQNVTAPSETIDVTIGSRWQQMRQEAKDEAAAMTDSATRSRNAWELGVSDRVTDNVRVYGKINRTFRFPNTDELFGYDPIANVTVFRGDLRPQQGTTREAGASLWVLGATLRASLFRLDLTDEIAFDGQTYTNVNLPATRHQGMELEGEWHPSESWLARLAYTHSRATAEAGSNAGNDIPMIPREKATLELRWSGTPAGTWAAVANYVGSQRYSGDEANTKQLLNAYTTLDLRADWNFKPWSLSARITNLTNRRYASYSGYSSNYSDYYYYPADPRSLFVTATHHFL
jgi:iron complex outermembrane receptor protein